MANVTNIAMGAAPLVVGQYYMKQINDEMGAISAGISRLESLYKNEYMGRVITLVSQVRQSYLTGGIYQSTLYLSL